MQWQRQISEEGNLWQEKKGKVTVSSWDGVQELQSLTQLSCRYSNTPRQSLINSFINFCNIWVLSEGFP